MRSSTSSKSWKTSGAGCSRLTTVVSCSAWLITRSHLVTLKVVAESSPAPQHSKCQLYSKVSKENLPLYVLEIPAAT